MQKQKTKFIILSVIFLFTSIILLQGCKDDTVTSPEAPAAVDTTGLVRLGKADAIGARANVILYLDEPLHIGYNKVYALLHDSLTGAVIKDAHVIPSLTDHTLGGPVEGAPEEANSKGLFPFAVIFLSPQAVDHWNIKIGVHNHGAAGEPYGTASFGGLHISDYTGKFVQKDLPGGPTIYLSYINPKSPAIGMNNFEFLINSTMDTLNFRTDTSYAISLKPVLISSGLVSTGNVNPVPAGELRHYTGKLNLPAAGNWRINMYMTKTGFSDSTYFDIGF
ncbi:MAG: hypothetical protein J0M18_16450 [Ignavibacteria bacterium]|nr:hypothetical protein [Ignavibacteria bacterium]